MKYKISRCLGLFPAFVLPAAFGLNAQRPEWKGGITFQNDVRTVKNPKEPKLSGPAFRLEEDMTMGGPEPAKMTTGIR